jgi:hypothetical protein
MSQHRHTIYLDAGNPYDFERDALDELAATLNREVEDIEAVPKLRDETGYGVTLHEVLVIWMGTGAAIQTASYAKTIVTHSVDFLRRRWRKDHEQSGDAVRPRTLWVADADGRIIQQITIDLPDGTPQESAPNHKTLPRPKPSRRD